MPQDNISRIDDSAPSENRIQWFDPAQMRLRQSHHCRRRVRRIAGKSGRQTKFKVSGPGDIYEREAERIADQLMAAPVHSGVGATRNYSALQGTIGWADNCGTRQCGSGPGQPRKTSGTDVAAGNGAAFRLRLYCRSGALRSAGCSRGGCDRRLRLHPWQLHLVRPRHVPARDASRAASYGP